MLHAIIVLYGDEETASDLNRSHHPHLPSPISFSSPFHPQEEVSRKYEDKKQNLKDFKNRIVLNHLDKEVSRLRLQPYYILV